MFMQRIVTEGLAQASFLVACERARTAPDSLTFIDVRAASLLVEQ